MKIEAILGLVMAEIDRAEKLHPVWPADLATLTNWFDDEPEQE